MPASKNYQSTKHQVVPLDMLAVVTRMFADRLNNPEAVRKFKGSHPQLGEEVSTIYLIALRVLHIFICKSYF
jgi:hypothetical protein